MDDDRQDDDSTQEPPVVTGSGGLTIHKPGAGTGKDGDDGE